MKRYIKSARKIPIGKLVCIQSPESAYDGEWGVIKSFDGEYYYVAINNSKYNWSKFLRSELFDGTSSKDR